MRRFIAVLGAMGVVSGLMVSSSGADSPKTDARACGDDGDQIVFKGFSSLWPPNHKYRTITIEANGANSLEGVRLDTAVASNEPDVGLGAGGPVHDQDANPAAASDPETPMTHNQGSATTSHQLRGERSGLPHEDPDDPQSDKVFAGRTYTITATAQFENGLKECTEQFEVTVPHDQASEQGILNRVK